MARKVRGFERVLDAPALFAIAYGEIGSSIYIALGIVAAAALGSDSASCCWARASSSCSSRCRTRKAPPPSPRRAAPRRSHAVASTISSGSSTGWALFLDYLIVIALSALFLPHYVAAALSLPELRDSPWDVVVAVVVIGGIAAVRLLRRARLHAAGLAIALLDLVVQAVVVVLGLALLFSPETLVDGISLAPGQGWGDVLFAIPLGMLAYTGLETVANLAEEAREPGRTLPRSLFSAIGLVVLLTVLVAGVGMSAFPGRRRLERPRGRVARGTDRRHRDRVRGTPSRRRRRRPPRRRRALRGADPLRRRDDVDVGQHAPRALDGRARDAAAGVRPARASHARLPGGDRRHRVDRRRDRGRRRRRRRVPRERLLVRRPPGVHARAARRDRVAPARARTCRGPFRAGPDIVVRGVPVPLPAVVGATLTFGIWVLSMITHPGARYAGPAWLAVGLVVFLVTRWWTDRGLLEDVDSARGVARGRLVPASARADEARRHRRGDGGDRDRARQGARCRDRGDHGRAGAAGVPAGGGAARGRGRACRGGARRGSGARARARRRGADAEIVRARSIGYAIVEEAERRGVDLIVLGSSARWRRQSRFFSPTVDHVLKNAGCEVLVIAFPDGVFEDGVTASPRATLRR